MRLYILGDFFEYWAGDDDLANPFHLTITSALAQLAARGTRIYLMHGNRDFLLSDAFMRAAQATWLPDPTHIDLYGVPTLLMHGDTLWFCAISLTYFFFVAPQSELCAQLRAARENYAAIQCCAPC